MILQVTRKVFGWLGLLLVAALAAPPSLAADPARAMAPHEMKEADLAKILAEARADEGQAAIVRAIYDSDGARFQFVREGALGSAGARLLEALDRLDDHGVATARYEVEVLQALRGALPDPEAARALDARLVLAFVRVAWDLGTPERSRPDRIVSRIGAARGGAEAMARALADWMPPWPQYAKLVRAHRRYVTAAAGEGAIPPLGDRGLPRPGDRSVRVSHLRQRLALEGYFDRSTREDGPEGDGPKGDEPEAEHADLYDGPLREAVGHFQFTHGLEATGTVDAATVAALRVPLVERAAQIRRALARLRESRARGLGTFLRVNVPEFVAEIYVDDRLTQTFRVVVGSDERVRNPRTGVVAHLNRTPLVQGEIDRVVVNPVWRVPPRIRDAEILPRAQKDPAFWDQGGYLVRGTSVVQLPGPANALGEVKFLFENEEGIYLHDTPLKRLFRLPRRALSHGCIRLEHPLVLARWLLDREDHVHRHALDEIVAGDRETELTLVQPLPIVIEYVTVTVDEQGRAHFLDDVYGLDSDASALKTGAAR